jgi:hypothetical protein
MLSTGIQYLLCGALMGGSMLLGFFLTGFLINRIQEDDTTDEETELHLNSFLEEYEYEPMSNLSERDLLCLKDTDLIMSLEPLLKQTIRMYYDHEDETFYYYSERETIYKYLEIVARRYVIQYHCKQIFVELNETETKKELVEPIKEGPFMTKKKNEKKILEKNFIRFVYKGNENDYLLHSQKNKPTTTSELNILDFLKMNKKEQEDKKSDSDDYETITKED